MTMKMEVLFARRGGMKRKVYKINHINNISRRMSVSMNPGDTSVAGRFISYFKSPVSSNEHAGFIFTYSRRSS